MSDTIEDLKEQEKAQHTEERAASTRNGTRAWLPGLILIVLGVAFLADNYYAFPFFENWWALFILVPAVSNLRRAWSRYQAAGGWTEGARGSLVGGLLLTLVAFIFLFDLSWTLFWPFILIVIGVGLLLRAV